MNTMSSVRELCALLGENPDALLQAVPPGVKPTRGGLSELSKFKVDIYKAHKRATKLGFKDALDRFDHDRGEPRVELGDGSWTKGRMAYKDSLAEQGRTRAYAVLLKHLLNRIPQGAIKVADPKSKTTQRREAMAKAGISVKRTPMSASMLAARLAEQESKGAAKGKGKVKGFDFTDKGKGKGKVESSGW